MITDTTQHPADSIENLIQSMSLREKIGQTVQLGLNSRFCNEETLERHLEEFPVGSVFCGGEIITSAEGKSAALREKLARAQRASKYPLLVAGDLESGAGQAVADKTRFPMLLSLAACRDEKMAYEYGKYTALEGREAGFNWTFAPVVDVQKNWLNPIVTNRGLGDDPQRVAALAGAIIEGMQDHGFAACAKHFPGDGVDFRDQHLITSVNSLTEEEWWEVHGGVFQSVIDRGVRTIMPGHIALPWCDSFRSSSGRPRPATLSEPILTQLLRERMGFEGVLVTDALIMAGFVGFASRSERLLQAFAAGNDVMLWPENDYYSLMERAIEEGRVSTERLEASVRRILTLKQQLGLLDAADAAEQFAPIEEDSEVRRQAVDLSARVADESITLVRNRENLLPLNSDRARSVLLHSAIPEQADSRYIDLLAETLEARGLEVTRHKNGNCLDVNKMEQEGKHWDAYLVVYSLQIHQMKNAVRPVGELGEVQWAQQYAETMKPITISLNTAYLTFDNPYLDTLVNAYSPCPTVIDALVRALFGELPFDGQSPVDLETIPERTGFLG
ncbi:glycoside hydrolase family 3 protein [Puniceicoccus vermicola]|uniref:beta-N-acetylhexosaminidase n=1 Tax=Puniceicoccus vermicola TaxID=388746 RepID=A0A7X1B1A2_9BACT|nr:glycoside hydrolase family 3 N-terminal domain-containing protein [Puniceicoccus vermicola]MBC2602640.1 hypothetical protein [Puniceicoccus vermicola]